MQTSMCCIQICLTAGPRVVLDGAERASACEGTCAILDPLQNPMRITVQRDEGNIQRVGDSPGPLICL